MARKLVSDEPFMDDVGVRHVTVYLIDPDDNGRVMSLMMLSFTPDREALPIAHGLEAKEWAEKNDVARLVQGVRAILKKEGFDECMIHSYEDPKTDNSWYIKAGAKHDVTFYRLPTGRN